MAEDNKKTEVNKDATPKPSPTPNTVSTPDVSSTASNPPITPEAPKQPLHTNDHASQEFQAGGSEHKIDVSRSVDQLGQNNYAIYDTTRHTVSGKKMSSATTEISSQRYKDDEYSAIHVDSSDVKQFDGKGNTIRRTETTHQYQVQQGAEDVRNGRNPSIVYDYTDQNISTMDKNNRMTSMEMHHTVDSRTEVQRKDAYYTYDKKEEVKSSILADYSLKNVMVERLEDQKNRGFKAEYNNDGSEQFTYTNKDKRIVYQQDAEGNISGFKYKQKGNEVVKYSELERKEVVTGLKKARQEADKCIAQVSSANSVDAYKALPGPTNFAQSVSTTDIFTRQTQQQLAATVEGTQVVQHKFETDRQITANDIALKKMQEARGK